MLLIVSERRFFQKKTMVLMEDMLLKIPEMMIHRMMKRILQKMI